MRLPHYIQNDAMDCGPSCLRMIAKYYGHHYTLQTLRNKCFITREGVSLLGICDAAESIGFRTNGVRLTLSQLAEEAKLPCILHWNQSHFVVCYEVKQSSKSYLFCIADPTSQIITYRQEEFAKCWLGTSNPSDSDQGIALLLEPSATFSDFEEEKEVSTKKSLLFFLRYLLPYKSQFIQLGIGMGLGSILQLAFPLLTRRRLKSVAKREGIHEWILT